MKYIRGYLVAGIFGAIALALTAFAKAHSTVVDMVYPYTTRMIQSALAEWTAPLGFCLWQLLAMLLIVGVLASLVVTLVLKWNVFQWLGWVLAAAAGIFLLHTGIYGLNSHAGPLAVDIRLEMADYTVSELAEATTYYRDKANALAAEMPRDAGGNLDFSDFETLSQEAGEGFHSLTYDQSLSVFAGSREPVKKLGWEDLYTAWGIWGVTMPLTGEAAVNPNIPSVTLPFTMCHEMAHRMCIAYERDANMAGFLACTANSNQEFQYSGYFYAFRFCYNALVGLDASTAREIYDGINDDLMRDLQTYRAYVDENVDGKQSQMADKVNDTYIKVSGDEAGTDSYNEVCDLLVSWYIQTVYLPEHQEEEVVFDPLDKTQVDVGRDETE